MCESKTPRVDDAPGEPVSETRQVQAAINILNIRYAGITEDVPTLQRLLREACAADRKLTARLIKARRQRDAAREEARVNCAAIVLSLTAALQRSEKINHDTYRENLKVTDAIRRIELSCGLADAGTVEERVERIGRCVVAERWRQEQGPQDPVCHVLEHRTSITMIDASKMDLLQAIYLRMMSGFKRERLTPRYLTMRMQDDL